MTFRTRSPVSFPPSLCFCKSLTSAISLLARSQSRWLYTTPVHTPSVIHVNPVASSSKQRGAGAASSAWGLGRWKCLLSLRRFVPLLAACCPQLSQDLHCPGCDAHTSRGKWLGSALPRPRCSRSPGKAAGGLWYTVKRGVAGTLLSILYIQILRSLLMTWCQFCLRLIDKVPSVFAVLPKQSITVGNNYSITNTKLKLFC